MNMQNKREKRKEKNRRSKKKRNPPPLPFSFQLFTARIHYFFHISSPLTTTTTTPSQDRARVALRDNTTLYQTMFTRSSVPLQLLATALLLSTALPAATAQEADVVQMKPEGDVTEAPPTPAPVVTQRTLGVSVAAASRTVTVTSAKQGAATDRMEFAFTASGYPNLRLRRYAVVNGTSTLTTTFRVGLVRLVELNTRDANSTVATAPSHTNVTGPPGDWGAVQQNVTTDANGTELHHFTTTRAYANGLRVSWDVYAATDFKDLDAGRGVLNPSNVKFGIRVQNYPWTHEAPKLALVLQLSASGMDDAVEEAAQGRVWMGAGLFEWERTATADLTAVRIVPSELIAGFPSSGVTASLDTQAVDGEGTRTVHYTVDTLSKPADLVWDPTLSAVDTGSTGDGARDVSITPAKPVGKVTVRSLVAAGNAGGGVRDRYDFRFSTNGFPNVRLDYYRKEPGATPALPASSSSSSSAAAQAKAKAEAEEVETSLRMGLVRLVEVNADNDARTSTSYVKLTGHANRWAPIAVAPLRGDNGAKVYRFETARAFGSGMRVVFTFFVSTSATNVTGVDGTLTPAEVKFGVRVENFPWKYTASKLVLQTVVTGAGVNDTMKEATKMKIGHGTIAWTNYVTAWEANLPAGAVPVKKRYDVLSSGLSDLDPVREGFDADDQNRTGEDVRWVQFTADTTSQPSVIDWDPSLTAARRPETSAASQSLPLANHLLLCLASLLLIAHM